MEYCNVKFYMAFAYCTIVFALYNTSFLTKCAADNIKWKKKKIVEETKVKWVIWLLLSEKKTEIYIT